MTKEHVYDWNYAGNHELNNKENNVLYWIKWKQ